MLKKMFEKLFNEQKFFRRTILIWAMTMLTAWSVFLMDASLLVEISASGAAVVSTIFAILTSVIGFYQWHRKSDDEKEKYEKDNPTDQK